MVDIKAGRQVCIRERPTEETAGITSGLPDMDGLK
jgi:hypothetical protein